MNEDFTISKRREAILDMMHKNGRVKVTDLSEMFGISEVTVRSDLTDLEKEGLLVRVHGGATRSSMGYHNMSYLERKSKNTSYKQQIAKTTASMINDGETVVINSGTTTHYIAHELKMIKNLNIVTNSIAIAMELGHLPNLHIILLGGNINSQYSFTYGDDTVCQLKKYKADKLILAVDGVSHLHGITTYHFQETEINRVMIERVDSTIVVADYTKIGKESFSNIAGIDSVDYLVTNGCANVNELDMIAQNGVEIRLGD